MTEPPIRRALLSVWDKTGLVEFARELVGMGVALVSTGAKEAVAIWGGLSAHGRWAWKWKDRIDRRWVARYRASPVGG